MRTTVSAPVPDPLQSKLRSAWNAGEEVPAADAVPTPAPPRTFAVRLMDERCKYVGPHVETCPPGCVLDHAMDAKPTGTFKEDLWHQIGEERAVTHTCILPGLGAMDVDVLRAGIRVVPYASDPQMRLPYVFLEFVDQDAAIEVLDPDGLAEVIGKLRAHLDQLDDLREQLIQARADATAEVSR